MAKFHDEITGEAISSAGGHSAVAQACGIKRHAVWKWRQVPAIHVLTVERLGGIVTRYEMRPDVFGEDPHP